ncbi:NADH dehydrogenase FAD-containing subunit [Ruminiclostridium sufflavum DSM 19573]|uniref:NADH:ubiquinone reductase (non-electrogenic) n=1 Tax=Ruminiclostridium sufflavum DSM 19573 TaxID=1121337 RepID=A0A318XK56_9FIRM|nr:NAD(P)/FAD-dependent oxidoreductase [Ruminiclostridium sufflavum]PYG87741.1 NADH dehydrogenase FAD-containing subunit [Ruminiclostridium sufflavum DSM 19573]
MKSKIVIIGAGYAGILTAKKLAKKFKKDDTVSITIIDKNPFHTMLTELHEVAANRVDEDSIKIGLKKVFAGRKVNVVLDAVEAIDFNNKIAAGENQKYEYDYLVLAAGSKPTCFGVAGAEEYSHRLWSYQDAVNLKDHIHNAFRKAACESNIDEKKRLLTFYVVGAGFTGVEMAGELAEYVPILCEKYEIDREFVSVCNVDILKRTVPNLPEKLSEKVERRFNKMGVKLMLNSGVSAIGPDFIEIKSNNTVNRYAAGTVIWAAGIESSDITNEAAKTLESANRGRIKLDSFLRSVNDDHVYVVGDNMLFTAEGEEGPVPQMVENCEQSAATAAKNIYCAVTGKGEMSAYKPAFHGMMVCVGGRYGVARVGMPNHMFNLPSFLAMFVKHFINIIYFIQVSGWNKVFSYLKHEFFTIRNCRSFVGGHFSNRTPSFLLTPVRVWLGAVWLFEGIMKIVEGWLTAPKLTEFFKGADSWYNSILYGSTGAIDVKAGETAVQAATEAVSSATGEVAASVGTTIMNFDILGLLRLIFVSGKELSKSVISDYAFKIDIPLINWFVNKLIIPNDNVQIVMQVFIVVAEILIGLALIGGLFTTPASAFSLVLQVMFVSTTGLYLSTFWMIFAAIAVLIGAGKTFGLDYYAMPYLKRMWRKLPFVRRLYIYND